MFEKESEEWADKGFAEKYKTLEWYARKNNFQKGAEFGYNKAKEEYEVKLKAITENRNEIERTDEWHYVMDGDFPEAHKPVLISDVFGHCESGYYFNGDWFGRDNMFHDVFAWQECPPQSERMKLASEAILAKGRENAKTKTYKC